VRFPDQKVKSRKVVFMNESKRAGKEILVGKVKEAGVPGARKKGGEGGKRWSVWRGWG